MRAVKLTTKEGDVWLRPSAVAMVYDNPLQGQRAILANWHGATVVTMSGQVVEVRERADYIVSECNRHEPMMVAEDFGLKTVKKQ